MKMVRLVVLGVLGVAAAAPLSGQGIPRGARMATQAKMAPRLMVANPFASAPTDSAAAVQIGTAVREEMKNFVDEDYIVVEQEQMNEALVQYGYPPDAILNPTLAVTLAKNIQARFVVTGTMTKGPEGRYVVTARLAGVNDEAGQVVTVEQAPRQSFQNFGERIADALKPAVQTLANARACVEQRHTKPEKAADAANKAIKKLPDHGLAQLCLAQLAVDRKAPREEVVQHLQAAVKGDPLSLPAWTQLAAQYQMANDTTNALAAFRQLLRLAPTNQKLREEIFKYFLQTGHPEMALEVADEGLKLDPQNADLHDLKSNACLFLSNFKCAIDELEIVYALDSTKADTLFFAKISAAAAEGEKPDTARLVKWAQLGAQKYPENLTLLDYLNRGYVLTGQVDSSLAVTQRIMAKDTTAVVPALAAVQALAEAKRLNEATPYIDFVKRYGDKERKEQLAVILVNGALGRLQGDSAAGVPRDLPGAVDFARSAIEVADPAGKVAASANYILGLGLFFQAAEMDEQTEKQKSCDMARQEQQLLQESEAALTKGQATNPAVQQYLGYIKKFNPRVTAMLKAYCK